MYAIYFQETVTQCTVRPARLSVRKMFLQTASVLFLAVSISQAATREKELGLINASNDEKVKIMCHFSEPKRVEDILFQIAEVNILLPELGFGHFQAA